MAAYNDKAMVKHPTTRLPQAKIPVAFLGSSSAEEGFCPALTRLYIYIPLPLVYNYTVQTLGFVCSFYCQLFAGFVLHVDLDFLMHRLKVFNTSPQPNHARLLAQNPWHKANKTKQVCMQKTDLQQLAPTDCYTDTLLHKNFTLFLRIFRFSQFYSWRGFVSSMVSLKHRPFLSLIGVALFLSVHLNFTLSSNKIIKGFCFSMNGSISSVSLLFFFFF